ncbi:LamG domain-containing protein [Jiangella ureilytica]|uniref:LamG domain-containing protein n=1 Tax=Jiangella ureilytica TaxID=2530374 RepID=A0A4R4RH05_9ACTN|nr:LamG domain-containing protein [Jiangella ureilytica]TDC48657.1 LamG domain-containing protein [Jiangella ureilytica]
MRAVAGTAAALMIGTLLPAPVAPAAPAAPPSAAPPSAAPPSAAPPDETAVAVEEARSRGERVEVTGLRTETRTVFAEPDGTMTAELSSEPERMLDEGGWVDIDTTLAQRGDGTVGPVATPVAMAFSGGGDGPLVRYGRDDAWIELSWPDGELPEPVLHGAAATYPEVLPGVDLVLEADADGYAQYLVVESAEAAANPAVREVRLGVRTDGVGLTATPGGGLEARDSAGVLLFSAAPSIMWDASTPERRQASVGVAVDDGALVLRPDEAFLDDEATRYPVTVDPKWHTADKQFWTTVLSGSDQARPNSSGEPPLAQVGHCWTGWSHCNGIGIARTYWRFDTSFLAGKEVLEAYMDVTVVYSPSCATGSRHELWEARTPVDNSTRWGRQPVNDRLGSFVPPAVNALRGCPGNKGAGLLVTSAVNKGGYTTFLIKAENEGDLHQNPYWRKYDNNAKLRVKFNTHPSTPTGLTSDPAIPAPCHWCGGVRYVSDDSIRFQARLADPDPADQLRALWQVKVNGVATQTWGGFKSNGSIHDLVQSLPRRQDGSNAVIEWAVKGDDGAHGSPWALGPTFVSDRTAPAHPPTVAGRLYAADNRWHGGVGVEGTFDFGANGVGDIDHYLYGWNGAPTGKIVARALGGPATIRLIPPGDGPQDLYVWSVDRAGHRSQRAVHHFYVRAGNGPLGQWSLDGSTVDDAFLGDRDGVAQGGLDYVPGAVGQALRLDGVNGSVAVPNAVRTDESFSVAAWVRLDAAGGAHAAVSQDSDGAFAGFDLWYRPESGRWAFGMARDKATYKGTDMAQSAQPARVGVWTHLTGVYDAEARTLQLYVDGVPSGPAVTRVVPDWHANGYLRIGRTQWNGNPAVDHWPGAIDEVEVYDRVLRPEEVHAAVGADNVQVAHWAFEEPSGTTARNAVPGDMLALSGGAELSGDDPADPDQLPDGGAVGGGLLLPGDTGPNAADGGQAVTGGPVVHTDQAFTVAGWVRLDEKPADGATVTALSQDGGRLSGFFLGYRQLGEVGVWELYSPDSADGGGQMLRSPVDEPAVVGDEVHLAVVYDDGLETPEVRLYVNGDLVATAPQTRTYDATGAFVVGRGFNGGPSGYWAGMVDEVRVYSRAVTEAELQGLVSRDGVTVGEWALDGNAEEATGRLPAGSAEGGVEWTAGQTNVPDPTDLAARLDGDGAHLRLPHAVDVERTFAVTAWAKLDEVGGNAAVVSQDGSRTSGFQLQATADGHWAFAMFGADVNGGGSRHDRIVGPEAQPGVWTHLAAVYDAGAKRMTLYVNGVDAGTAEHHQTWTHGTGALVVAAAQWNGAPADFFPGAVDDVAVFSRGLFAAEVRAMAGRDLTLVHQWQLDESSGELVADAVGRRTGTAVGATRVPGYLGNAVDLDGEDDHVSVTGVDVRSDASFSVSAWVRLEETCDPGDEFSCSRTAVSLDGADTSKFRLGHKVDQGQNDPGVWVFEMPSADESEVQPPAAVTVIPSDLEEWVHLVGVYDATTGQLWLYVNGTRKGGATLLEPWQADGALAIGRGLDAAGEPGQFFHGKVDDVRVYGGALDDARIGNLYDSYPEDAGTAPVPVAGTARWTLDENTPTVPDSAPPRSHPATVTGATWLGSGRIGAGRQFDGADDQLQTAGPVVTGTGSFTVTAWAYLSVGPADTATRTVVSQDGGAGSAFALAYDGATRSWRASLQGASGAPAVATSAEPATAGLWTNLALVYDAGPTPATTGQLRLYVNGRLAGAAVGVAPPAADGVLAIGRGRSGGAAAGFFKGVLDDVRVFGGALSTTQLRAVHDDTPASVQGTWPLDDSLADTSSRANAATADDGGVIAYGAGVRGRALVLDGESAATTGRWGVQTGGSFTVSAWAKLTHEPAVQTVLSQDGIQMSGFVLQYEPSLDRWIFGAPAQDADGARTVYARSERAAVLNEWTHLTGVYDYAARQLRLYVDGELAGARDDVSLWSAGGGLAIGRALYGGDPALFFRGSIDEVRVDAGIVPDAEIAARATTPQP